MGQRCFAARFLWPGAILEQVIKNDLSSFPLNLGTYKVDRADSSVTGTVWGFALRKAIYRYGLGGYADQRDDGGGVEGAADGAGGAAVANMDTVGLADGG